MKPLIVTLPAALHLPCAVELLCPESREFSLRPGSATLEADFWFLYFYPILECAFTEIVGFDGDILITSG